MGIGHTVEGALVQNVANALINRAVANVVSTGNRLNVFAGFGVDAFSLPVVLSDGTQLASGAAFNVGQGISGFVGSYLASKIVSAQTIGGNVYMLAANDMLHRACALWHERMLFRMNAEYTARQHRKAAEHVCHNHSKERL